MAMPSSSSRRTGNPVSDVVELEVELLEPRGTATAPDGEVPLRPDVPAFAILVVDDDPDLRRYVRRSLKRPGHPETQVVEAGDGPEALRIVADAPLDLVITDVVMPGMDGFNLVQAIRRSHSADRLPVRGATPGRARTPNADQQHRSPATRRPILDGGRTR
jgi:CheY-like chemotaxis protein